MSDYIEVDGSKYYAESYLELANENTRRAQAQLAEANRQRDEARGQLAACVEALKAQQELADTVPAILGGYGYQELCRIRNEKCEQATALRAALLTNLAPAAEAYRAEVEKPLRERVARLEAALTKLWKHTPKIDNGRCAVCRRGYRYFDTKGNVGDPCSDQDCLSHAVEAALAPTDNWFADQIEAAFRRGESAVEGKLKGTLNTILTKLDDPQLTDQLAAAKAEGAREALEVLLAEEDWLYPEVRAEIQRRAVAARKEQKFPATCPDCGHVSYIAGAHVYMPPIEEQQ